MRVLDMVMAYGAVSLNEAAECVAAYFDIPKRVRGSHLSNPEGLLTPPSADDPLILLVKSGVWSDFPVPVQRLIPILLSFGKFEDGKAECVIEISYRAMMTYSGIGTYTSISKALTHMGRIGWLQVLDSPRGDSPVKATGRYLLTPLSKQVRNLADATAPKFGASIKAEKDRRTQERKEREALLKMRSR